MNPHAPETKTPAPASTGNEHTNNTLQINYTMKNLSLENQITLINQVIKDATNQNPDVGAVYEPDVITAFQVIRDADKPRYIRIREELKKIKGISITELEKVINEDKFKPNGKSTNTADALLDLIINRLELFHDQTKTPFVSFWVDDKKETWPINSKGFSEWLAMTSFNEMGRSPSETTIKTIRTNLSGLAKFKGEQKKVFLRVADYRDGYIIDLGDDKWRGVLVDAEGWEIIDNLPVKFWRSETTQALPQPTVSNLSAVDSNLSPLWSFANIKEDDRILVLAFILESWRNNTNFPILELSGEQGCAKSTTQKILRAVIDPNEIPLRASPKNVEDLFVSASSNWLVCYDNLSFLNPRMQDAFCSLATGGGYAARTLYTNLGETIVDVSRPAIINGIDGIARAQDMLDRVIRIELPVIVSYRTDSEMKAEFEKAYPGIVGGLLDLFSAALRKLPEVKHLPIRDRMADFILLGEAIMLALDCDESFFEIYDAKKTEAITYQLESSPIITALLRYKEKCPQTYYGTVGRLLEKLNEYRPDYYTEGWPKSGNGLVGSLKRNAPALRKIGISFAQDKKRKVDGYYIRIFFQEPEVAQIGSEGSFGTLSESKNTPRNERDEANEPIDPVLNKTEKNNSDREKFLF